jgi:chemosensory pili system protein ChpA (sensor histidine kinase/response regulator)
MVAERRDYVALDWVAAELGDTLNQAATALNAWLENTDDTTQLRFCLAYVHQVYGTLKMVEFAGAALLAEEIETTAHALLTGTIPTDARYDTAAALKTALTRLPAYLQQLQRERTDRPTALLALINDLRALRNDTLITESAIFSPLLAVSGDPHATPLDVPEGELALAAGKLRQMYQMAMLNYLRGHEPRENLNYLAKVCARLAKLATGRASEELWKVAIALFEGLLNKSIPLTPAIKSLLQQIDNQLRAVVDQGPSALRAQPPVGLLKNLLYYIAASSARTRFITEVKQSYRLAQALPEDDNAVDPDALRAIKAALSAQLDQLADTLAEPLSADYTVPLLGELRRAQDTTALLGLNRAQLLLHDVAARLQSQHFDFADQLPPLRELAAELAELPQPAPAKTLFNDSEEAQEQLDKAFDAVLLESRNGLEQAKEAIIEFVANQWRHQYLEDVPALLASVRGGLLLAGLDRAANVLAACENYVRQDLLGSDGVPPWHLLDTLADAIASVDYYLERRAEGSDAGIENIMDVAEESVAALGYPTDGRIVERPRPDTGNVIPFPVQVPVDTSERFDDQTGLDAEAVNEADQTTEIPTLGEPAFAAEEEAPVAAAAPVADEPAFVEQLAFAEGEEPDAEIAEIFVEEAGEVLATIDEYLPQWRDYPADAESLAVIRRAFHTLKGSGRMVGATQIGELAWSIENMLNRVIDGTVYLDTPRVDAVVLARELVPAMVASFERRVLPDMRRAQPLIERAQLLAREQNPVFAEPAVVEPVSAEQLPAEQPLVRPEEFSPEFAALTATSFGPAPDEAPAEPFAPIDAADMPLLSTIDDFTAAETAPETFAADNFAVESFAVESEFDAIAEPELIDLGDLTEPDDEPSAAAEQPADTAPAFEFPTFDEDIPAPTFLADDPFGQHATEPAVDFTPVEPVVDFTPAEPAIEIPTLEPIAAEADDDSDQVLLEIFTSEAGSHLDTLEAFLRMAREQFGPVELNDNLQRALHTLKGSAQMAGVAPIAAVVTPVEYLVKELRAAQIGADAEVLDLLDTTASLLHAGLAQLATTPYAELPGTDAWVAHVDTIYHARIDKPQAVTGTGNDEAFSPALLNQFLGDAIEQISAVADDLDLWAAMQLGDARQHTLPATVSQVADAAEALGIGAVSELAQALQTLLRRGADAPAPGADFFELAKLAAERIIDMFDRLAANQEPQPDESLLALLQEFEFPAEPPLLDASIETPLGEAPAFEADFAAPEPVAEAFFGTAFETSKEPGIEPAIETSEPVADLIEPISADEPDTDVAPVDLGDAVAELAEADLGALTDDLAAFAHDEEEPHDDHLIAIDDLEGETVDLDAAFAADPLDFHPSPAAAAFRDYLDAMLPRADQPLEPPPLPLTTSTPTAAADTHPYSSGDAEIDAEILEIFLEEAVDLLENLDESITAWSTDRDNSSYLDELQRLLHTLKGGARLAGLKNLGNLAHNFETLLINAQQQGRAIDDALMTEVQTYQDQLVRMVDAVKSGGHSADASNVVEDLAPDTPAAPAEATVAETIDIALPAAAAPIELVARETETADDIGLDTGDVEGVIVPFVRSAAPRAASQPLHPVVPLGEDIEGLPDTAAGAVLRRGTGPQEVVKISAQLLEQLVNLAGETSIARSRAEEQVSEFVFALDEMQITVERLQEQVRRLDIETEAQVIHRQEQVENVGAEGFDPLEFDRYSLLQQLSRSLLESASDLIDIKSTLADKSRDMETLLIQQGRINTELQEGLMRSRMVPFARMVPRLRRIVRQIAGELHKQIDFHIDNAEGELDRTVLERIVAPLEHMLRNAVDHGIETPAERTAAGKNAHGTVVLGLTREGGEIVLTLTDDGRGVDLDAVRRKAIDRGLMAPAASLSDHEVLQFILESGFSTAQQVTQISGRGVGMDVVASEIKQLGGSLDIDSRQGQGTRFTIRLPFTVSVNRALMVSVGGDIYAIPLNSIEGIVRVSPFELEAYYQPEAPLFEYAGQPYLMRYMGALLRTGDRPTLEGQSMPLPVLLVRGADHAVAVQVDGLLGSREIVVKTLGPQFGMVHGLSGATVLGDGSVVVILDLMAMIRADAMQLHRDHALHLEESAPDRSRPLLVMVVDDSVTVRKVTSRFLERLGMEVMLAKDGVDAIALLQESDRVPDVMLLDIEMPRMDGFEVASRIRHTSRWQHLPIIMITSRTGDKHRERAFSLGVNRYLGKPYQEMVLLETINELCGTTSPA